MCIRDSGTLQATEALKIAAGIGSTLCGRMLFIDALNMQFDTIKVKRRKRCPVCGERH